MNESPSILEFTLESPALRGRVFPVHDILELVREGIGLTDIVKNYYPDLTVEDIKACIPSSKDECMHC